MADEFICEGCSYSSQSFEEKCPLCGGRVVNIDDGIDDRAFAENYREDSAPQDDLELDEMPRMA